MRKLGHDPEILHGTRALWNRILHRIAEEMEIVDISLMGNGKIISGFLKDGP